ncbi:MAG: hypothetical protein NTV22_13820 [bacterium]|nr:hypothetical protein [bacterium]
MGLLAKIFGAVSAKERKGICLDGRTPQWKVSKAKDLPAFLRALAELAPADAILYLEGGTPPTELLAFFREHAVPEQSHIAMGTIWPRPLVVHLPATRANLVSFAALAERCATPEAAIHLHLYHQGRVLLQWYDAFYDPFHISKEIPEERVQKLCSNLGLKYETDSNQ